MKRATAHVQHALGNHPYFSVQEIRVTGSRKVSGSQIVSMTGVRIGMNMWEVDPQRIEAKLNRHPWVRGEVVRREFPKRVLIQVDEWEAKAVIVLDKLYYADQEGTIFKKVDSGEVVNLPFITGLGDKKAIFHNPFAREKIAEAIRLNSLMAKNSIVLSEIHFLPHKGVVVYPTSHPVPLHMGWGDWSGKVHRLKQVLAEWSGRENRLTSLDLRFRDRVVVKLKGGAQGLF